MAESFNSVTRKHNMDASLIADFAFWLTKERNIETGELQSMNEKEIENLLVQYCKENDFDINDLKHIWC